MVNYTFVFIELMKEMFKRVGVVYHEDFCKKSDWYLSHSWSEAEYEDFRRWGCGFLKSRLKLTDCGAAREMGWFLLSYGWTTRGKHEE